MSKFVVCLSHKVTNLFSEELLSNHIEYLRSINKQGKLFLCGPFTDNDSAIQIIEAEDIKGARLIVNQDPFIQQGYYKEFTVKELIEATENNNWLFNHPQTKEKRASL